MGDNREVGGILVIRAIIGSCIQCTGVYLGTQVLYCAFIQETGILENQVHWQMAPLKTYTILYY